MATTLPGAPHPDESELDTLPVEPEFAPVIPEEPAEGEHEDADRRVAARDSSSRTKKVANNRPPGRRTRALSSR